MTQENTLTFFQVVKLFVENNKKIVEFTYPQEQETGNTFCEWKVEMDNGRYYMNFCCSPLQMEGSLRVSYFNDNVCSTHREIYRLPNTHFDSFTDLAIHLYANIVGE